MKTRTENGSVSPGKGTAEAPSPIRELPLGEWRQEQFLQGGTLSSELLAGDISGITNPIRDQISKLTQDVETLVQKFVDLEARINREIAMESEAIATRTIPREQAKEEIRHLYRSGGTHYISDVVEALNLSDELVVDLCDELLQEGELDITADAN